jgi:hypothetical protein
VVALPGFYRIAVTVLFYLGQRRDIYFNEDDPLFWYAQGCSALFFDLAMVYLTGAAINQGVTPLSCLSTALFTVIYASVVVALPLTSRFPPRWVRDLEASRTPEELANIRDLGRFHLEKYPRMFKAVINTHHGWESWLLTIIHPVPLPVLRRYAMRGEHALGNNLHETASTIADDIVAERPDLSVGYLLGAHVYIKNHQFDDAVTLLDTCIALEPHNVDFYLQRARVHLVRNQMEAAFRDMETVSALQPDNERLAVLREIAARRQRQVDESRS